MGEFIGIPFLKEDFHNFQTLPKVLPFRGFEDGGEFFNESFSGLIIELDGKLLLDGA